MIKKQILQIAVVLGATLSFVGCGSGDSSSSSTVGLDSKYSMNYKGLVFYEKNLPISSYKLTPLSDSEFNALTQSQKLLVADKLLSSMFFGYPLKELQTKINSGTFISSIQKQINVETTDKAWLESYIINEDYFRQNLTYQEGVDVLSRFYAAKDLDRYFFHNWVAYILTQNIMFSPAYELDSSHSPNVARVYNRLVTMLDDEAGMRFITYNHMMSEDNWRRFRSPEDNGREMLEIYTLDLNDAHVPIAGKALQNWKLDRDNDTLVIGLNENTQELNLFNTSIVNGDDFYRELAKSSSFTYGVASRLVSFFFTDYTEAQIDSITNTIVSSKPETWQDILKQIIFSKEYLVNSSRAKSAEEVYFSLTKKMNYLHRDYTIYYFYNDLETMHQASMKYKLGKLTRVPLDTLSFATYHKTIREGVLLRRSNPDYVDDYDNWSRQGWSDSFLDNANFTYDYSNEEASLVSLINYMFKAVASRAATAQEIAMFKNHMIVDDNGEKILISPFDMFREGSEESYKRYIAYLVLDYISRLDSTYMHKKVN
ncbi:MAG: hypothetical protein U9Q40_07225 [Campylobacterota bacterium]|nr:hypothetical protein [Campylobacterota bacterium]